jgi:hypothetical protein
LFFLVGFGVDSGNRNLHGLRLRLT